MRDLLWRTQLRDESTIHEALRVLRERCTPRGPSLGVEIFEVGAEHQIVLVPRTGRIQIRIYGLTPQKNRQQAAFSVAAWLEGLLQRRPERHPEEHRP
ncbi:MAG TPA: hypothetical protein ENK31_10090 [Nannocystis exedens]|nr:hypothetical protein [Nannocystis exedens]